MYKLLEATLLMMHILTVTSSAFALAKQVAQVSRALEILQGLLNQSHQCTDNNECIMPDFSLTFPQRYILVFLFI